ncbi:MAG: lcfB1 [Clostridia bacterium]|nr:lcfB1 [Clostridia bacterium]
MSELWNITMSGLLESVASRLPDHLAVKYTDRPYCRTYAEFNAECDRIAKGLLSIGVKKGEHVAVWATNYPEWLLLLFSSAKIGAILVTVNTNYKVFELEYLLKQSDSKVLVMVDGFKDSNYINIINELCPDLKASEPNKLNNKNLPFLKSVIYVGENEYPGMMNWKDMEKQGEEISDEEYNAARKDISPDDVINMQYTSGTTGFPKGVMLTHKNIINNGRFIGDCMKFTKDDKLCITVPFFHCFGLVLGIMACVTHDSSMIPVDYFSPVKVMDAVQNEECTALHGVPTMFIAILEHPEFNKYKFSRLRTGIMAGSPCPVKVMKDVIEKMGANEITITYGQTESSPADTMTTTDDSFEHRVNSVGKAMPHTETKIVDPLTGETLPPHVSGEFCARGYNIMKGYYKMPEATQSVIDTDGWLHTGDLASVDEDGYYKITGRIKDMIIRGGENIYPKEIEEFLYTQEGIKDVQVVGVPSKQYGEEVMAFIILREGAAMTEDIIKELVRSHMARHKVPKYIAFIDAFPTTASGKIQKFKLREMAIEMFNLQDAANIETA